MLVLPSQTPGLIERLGIARGDADAEAWAVERTGTKYGGASAINRVLGELGGIWRIVGMAYRVPPLRWIEDRGYRWIATHRHLFGRIGVTPECERPGISCEAAN